MGRPANWTSNVLVAFVESEPTHRKERDVWGTGTQLRTKGPKQKKDTAHAVSLPTSNLIYLFSLSDPAPNSLRCITVRAALADAAAGMAAAAP